MKMCTFMKVHIYFSAKMPSKDWALLLLFCWQIKGKSGGGITFCSAPSCEAPLAPVPPANKWRNRSDIINDRMTLTESGVKGEEESGLNGRGSERLKERQNAITAFGHHNHSSVQPPKGSLRDSVEMYSRLCWGGLTAVITEKCPLTESTRSILRRGVGSVQRRKPCHHTGGESRGLIGSSPGKLIEKPPAHFASRTNARKEQKHIQEPPLDLNLPECQIKGAWRQEGKEQIGT